MIWLLVALAALSPPDTYLEVDGGKLWYQECGSASAPNVVLLHDGLVHSITWDGVWTPLCAHYHVVRYDRRGYGRSSPANAPFVPEGDLVKIMQHVHMDHAIIVGCSSGAGLALDFAVAHPRMTDALFLIGPVVHGMASTDYFNERGSRNNAPLDHGDTAGAARNWSNDRFLVGGDDPKARQALYDALMSAPWNLSVAGGLERRPSPPTVGRLSEIQAPTLVLVGEDDIADVFAYAGAIEAAVPVASFEVWKNTGHLIQLQRPDSLAPRFERFVTVSLRKEVALTPRALDAYVGRYRVYQSSGRIFRDHDHLVLEIPGAPYYRLFAASPNTFFLRTEDTRIEFLPHKMVIHNSDGSVVTCPRVE